MSSRFTSARRSLQTRHHAVLTSPTQSLRIPFLLFVGLACSMLLALAVVAGSADAATTPKPPSGQIAYVKSDGAKGSSIWLTNTDGTGSKMLTDQVGEVEDMHWSKDGSKLAIVSGAPHAADDYNVTPDRLWTMSADGKNLKRIMIVPPKNLSSRKLSIYSCDWSPDGTKLAVTASYSEPAGMWGESFLILVVNATTGQSVQLGNTNSDVMSRGHLSWSKDGQKILFDESAEESGGLAIISGVSGASIGSVELQFGQVKAPAGLAPVQDYFIFTVGGEYSPDGKRLAFIQTGYRIEDGGPFPSYLMVSSSSGKGFKTVATASGDFGTPSWSSNGEWLAVSDQQGTTDGQIRLIEAKSGTLVALLQGEEPAWRPRTPFSPVSDGYAFRNMGYNDAAAGRYAWTHLFGDDLFEGWSFFEDYPYESFADKLFAHGVCYGLAGSSIAAYDGVVNPAKYGKNAKSLAGLGDFGIKNNTGSYSQLPAALKLMIEEYYTSQYAQPAADEEADNRFCQKADDKYPRTMSEFVNSLQSALADGPVSLGIYYPGHSLVAYKVDLAQGATTGKIEVYDCNKPGKVCYVDFSLSGRGSWSYSGHSGSCITFGTLSTIQQIVDAPVGSNKYYPGWVTASASASISFANAKGQVTGKVNGKSVEDNPQVRLDPVLADDPAPSSDRYQVVGEQARTFHLDSGDKTGWVTSRGTSGAYALLFEGAADITATYQGNSVVFNKAAGKRLDLTVENEKTLGQAVFKPSSSAGTGAVSMIGQTSVEVRSSNAKVSRLVLADSNKTILVNKVPAGAAIRAEISSFDPQRGTVTLSIDKDGDGKFETTKQVGAKQLKDGDKLDTAASSFLPDWLNWWEIGGAIVILALVAAGLVVWQIRGRRKAAGEGGADAVQDQPSICGNCGTKAEPDDTFCSGCGRSLER